MPDQIPKTIRKWYKKKRYLLPLALVTTIAFASGGSAPQAKPQNDTIVPVQQVYTPPQPKLEAIPAQSASLSNNNHYTNVDGNTIHSPAHLPNNSVPPNATFHCRDGEYSFAVHSQGACSRHGGIGSRLK